MNKEHELDFTYSSYRDLIQHLKDNYYAISNYHEYRTYEKVAILRHDVDMSVDKALALAELECGLGVCSTYFLLLSTDFYNIASHKVLAKIKRIREMGHEIGLHFDEVKYGNTSKPEGVLPYLQDEVKAMEIILNAPIRAISMHRPSNMTLEADYDFGGIANSYSKTFFRDFKYVSDSRRHWQEDVISVISSGSFNKLHILTHPFWYNQKELTIEQNIIEFVNAANWERYYSVRDNISDLCEIMPETEVRR